MNNKITTAFLTTLMALTAQTVVAQDAPEAKHSAAALEAVKVTIRFGGGTLAEFVDALQASQPTANIVLAKNARDVKIPAFSLQSAGLKQALEACCLSADRGYKVRVSQFVGAGEPVYSIVAQDNRRRPSTSASPSAASNDSRQLHSLYSLSELTTARASGVPALDVKTILSVIELAIEPLKGSPLVRFHQESGLLLLSAGEQHHDLVDRAMRALAMDLNNKDRLAVRTARQAKPVK